MCVSSCSSVLVRFSLISGRSECTNIEDGQSLVIEGSPTTQLTDEILVQLQTAPEVGDIIVVKLFLNEASDEDIQIFDVDDPTNTFNSVGDRMYKHADGYWRLTFDHTNWDDPVRIGVEARDDIPREDPHTAVIYFLRNDVLTADAEDFFG